LFRSSDIAGAHHRSYWNLNWSSTFNKNFI
jgi:hypothetical protein